MRRLDINLQKIGLSLGVEGFEEKATSSVKVDAAGDVTGDVAGRDINKNQYQSIRNSLAALSQPVQRLRDSVQICSTDTALIEKLNQLDRSNGNWFPEWCDVCLKNSEIQSQLQNRIKHWESQGWRTVAIDCDNIRDGIHVNLELTKPIRR